MHQTERKALADRLLGTAEKPGPIDVGWLKARYGITGTTIQRWREQGISDKRADDLTEALAEALGTTKEALRPDWAEGLADDIAGKVIAELTTSRADEMRRLIDDLEQRLAQRSEAPPVRTDTADQDG